MAENKTTAQTYTYSNESFSGCDMVATILISTDNSPKKKAYVIGELQTISYSIHMDRHPVRAIGNINVKDYVMGPRTIAGSLVFAVFNKHFAKKIMTDIIDGVKPGYAFLIDEIPPFDIVISAANEYGLRSRLVIYGVRLVNEGQVMSINDVYTENTYQFVATDLEYLTDENQYTSSKGSGRNIYMIDDGITSYRNEMFYKYDANGNRSINYKLEYRVAQAATSTSDALVEFTPMPNVTTGIIKIQQEQLENKKNVMKDYKEVQVDKNINSFGKILVPLESGYYTAIWTDGTNSSNTVDFRLADNSRLVAKTMPAPIIENVTETTISIISNVRSHSKAIYKTKSSAYSDIPLKGTKVTITELSAGTKYNIATANNSLGSISEYAKVSTRDKGFDAINALIGFIEKNKSFLKNKDFDIYKQVANEAKDYLKNEMQITAAFEEKCKKYLEELNALTNPKTRDSLSQQEEIDRLTALIDASIEMIYIANSLNNNSIYGYNHSSMIVEPPIVEHIDACTNSFIIGDNIAYLEFYINEKTTSQFVKKIEKSSFKQIDNKFVCTFNGKPRKRYHVYAVSSAGFKSPKVDFYILDDTKRAEALDKFTVDVENKTYQLERANKSYEYVLEPSLSDEDKKRVLTEIITAPSTKTISAPIVLESSKTAVTVSMNEPEGLLLRNNYRVVICPVEDVLMDLPRYKEPAKSTVEFNVLNHGLKSNTNYLIWVEDKDENQVSDAVSVCTKDADELDEENEFTINSYFIDKHIDNLREEFNKQNLMSTTLNNILYSNETNIDNTKTNTLDNILENILDNVSQLHNVIDILCSFFKVYLDSKYNIDTEFFKEAPVYSNKKLTMKEDAIAEIINISSSNEIVKEYKVLTAGESIKINNDVNGYTIITFANEELTKRSGFIIIGNLDTKIYKLKVKVGE